MYINYGFKFQHTLFVNNLILSLRPCIVYLDSRTTVYNDSVCKGQRKTSILILKTFQSQLYYARHLMCCNMFSSSWYLIFEINFNFFPVCMNDLLSK